MSILQIGAGGVGWVVAHKLAQHNDIAGDCTIASRRASRVDAVLESVRRKGSMKDPSKRFQGRVLDAHDVGATVRLIEELRPSIVVNAGPPWIDLELMEACLRTKTAYLDTCGATDLFSPGQQLPEVYDPQWALRERFAEAGVTGILGAGFDPGVVSVFAAYARKHLFDAIETIDVLDVNAGSHGRTFATNFDAETNLLEIQADSFYWEDRAWHQVPCHSRAIAFDFPEVGRFTLYSMPHDEVRSLAAFIPARRIEFWMGFSDQYLRYFNVLRDLGLLSPAPVTTANGVTVSPLQVVKAVLPDPTSLAPGYTGKTCIGTLVSGTRAGTSRRTLLYNICDHQASYAEVESQAISYTAGVPAAVAALLYLQGAWSQPGLWNVEQLDPDPFLELMPRLGLGWSTIEVPDDCAPVPRAVER